MHPQASRLHINLVSGRAFKCNETLLQTPQLAVPGYLSGILHGTVDRYVTCRPQLSARVESTCSLCSALLNENVSHH